MAGRPQKLTPDQQRLVGTAVRAGRSEGVPWKVLERIYGRDRTRLWRLARALGETAPRSPNATSLSANATS